MRVLLYVVLGVVVLVTLASVARGTSAHLDIDPPLSDLCPYLQTTFLDDGCQTGSAGAADPINIAFIYGPGTADVASVVAHIRHHLGWRFTIGTDMFFQDHGTTSRNNAQLGSGTFISSDRFHVRLGLGADTDPSLGTYVLGAAHRDVGACFPFRRVHAGREFNETRDLIAVAFEQGGGADHTHTVTRVPIANTNGRSQCDGTTPSSDGDMVLISLAQEVTWDNLLRLNPTEDVNGSCSEPYSSGSGYNGTPQWVHHSMSLAAYAGDRVRIAFVFDTRDGLYNSFEGWFVDNVRIGTYYDTVGIRGRPWQTFDSGDGPRWHRTSDRFAGSVGQSWNYSDPGSGTYQGDPTFDACGDSVNWGVLVSPPVTLPRAGNLEFDTLWEIESVDADGFDLMDIRIATCPDMVCNVLPPTPGGAALGALVAEQNSGRD